MGWVWVSEDAVIIWEEESVKRRASRSKLANIVILKFIYAGWGTSIKISDCLSMITYDFIQLGSI
jgi:hypothetical protein